LSLRAWAAWAARAEAASATVRATSAASQRDADADFTTTADRTMFAKCSVVVKGPGLGRRGDARAKSFSTGDPMDTDTGRGDSGGAREVVIPYRPRSVWLPYHQSEARWRVVVAHRRAGKTVAALNGLIRTALTCPRPNPRCAYVAPYLGQAKAVAWAHLKRFTAPIPGVSWKEAELSCDLPNGGRIRLFGADNPDALRGLYLDDVDCDEFGETAHTMLPIIEYGGAAYFTRMYDPAGLRPAVAMQLGNTEVGDGCRFCGRGYVQLTGRANYARAGLAEDPDRALDPAVAAEVLERGMREGWFGRRLMDVLPLGGRATRKQFIAARRVVNGQDRAALIADYALRFQDALIAGGCA